MSRFYNFPARREDIESCYDINKLKSWQEDFEKSLTQLESDYGGLDNLPDSLARFARAEQLNLTQIKFRIRKLSAPVSSAGALKAFHDMVKQCLLNEYQSLVQRTKDFLGRSNDDWDQLIKHNKKK